jgi:hypothetical protein
LLIVILNTKVVTIFIFKCISSRLYLLEALFVVFSLLFYCMIDV